MTDSRASQLYRTKRLSGRPSAARLVAVLVAAVAVLTAAPTWAASPQSDALARARLLYNQRQFEQAIQTAEKALSAPAVADSARVVIGRSYLERFRLSADPADLAAGRDVLLASKDRSKLYLVGEGFSPEGNKPFLDELFGGEDAIKQAWDRDDREAVVAAATRGGR